MAIGGVLELAEFIKEDDVQGLQTYLENRPDGLTALHIAVEHGQLETVRLLLRHGANLNAEDYDKCTALHYSARHGHWDICSELIEAGASPGALDSGQWSPLTWACYRGHASVAELLLEHDADFNVRGLYQVSGLVWAAGRGHTDVVELLLRKGAKVDVGDKYGTTALIWASRNGHLDIVRKLLEKGAAVDVVGMYSWTPLLVASEHNHAEIATCILEKHPNVNVVNKDGMTALTVACKHGYEDIAFQLISAQAQINVQDRAGDTNLIYAARGGHKAIVEALLKKHADVDMRGKEGKTCLHWAIDKGHTAVVRTLLSASPDLEIHATEGETPLLRAVRTRNAEIVQMLLDKKAKISAVDKRGDTALHIAMRARSKAIVEILLRNPKHSQLLYRPNRQGETPYNIDVNSQKTILGQVFGARRLNTNEDSENILGYDLYSSALADILTEPSLSMPITVGLYAKWGSGKSFLLAKLREEMRSFAREWIDPTFHMSPLLFFVILHFATVFGIVSWGASFFSQIGLPSIAVGFGVSIAVIVLSYLFLIGMWQGSYRYDWTSFYDMSLFLAKQFNSLKLILQVLFYHPPGPEFAGGGEQAQPLKLLFTDQTKVITSGGGQNSVTQMIGSLLDAIEDQYGKFPTRLYRAFRPQPLGRSSPKRWKKLCCLPYIIIYLACFFGVMAIAILACLCFYFDSQQVMPRLLLANETTTTMLPPLLPQSDVPVHSFMTQDVTRDSVLLALLVFVSCSVGLVLVANVYTFANSFHALIFSSRRHLQRAVAKLDMVKSEGYLQAVKGEVKLMLDVIRCLDSFTAQQTRLIVFVDGLDSCEQSKVLSVLDAVHMLFSDTGSPFIILLAIDPHVITKAIELNLNQAFSETSIGGHAYLRNLVHLPFFLQNTGLRKVTAAQQIANSIKKHHNAAWMEHDDAGGRRPSIESSYGGGSKKGKFGKGAPTRAKSRLGSSIGSSIGSNLNKPTTALLQGPQDLTKVMLNDDYFSDANPRSMRRLMNVIYVMGRLLKAFNIDFNWYHLASWVNITEQWPYRLSWIIYFVDRNEDALEFDASLKSIYQKIRHIIPTQKEMEPLLEMDRDEKKLETFLSFHKKNLTLVDLRIFLPFTINLDPYVKKVIKEEIQNMEEIGVPMEVLVQQNSQAAKPAPGNVGGGAPLTRRQAAGLRRSTAENQSIPNTLPPFQSMYYPQFPAAPNPPNIWPPYQMQMQQMQQQPMQMQQQQQSMKIYDQQRTSPLSSPERTLSRVLELPEEVTAKPLVQKSVEEVCDLVRSVSGITGSRLETYCSAVRSQNLSGAVLYNCNIDELKSIMNMNFGDWELFRLVLRSLRARDQRKRLDQQEPSAVQRVHSANDNSSSSREAATSTTLNRSASQTPTADDADKPKSKHQTVLEKQVTLEDGMILSNLLSTLSEEAHEDIVTEAIQQASGADSYDSVNRESDYVMLPSSSQAASNRSSALQTPNNSSHVENGLGQGWLNGRTVATSVGGTGQGTTSWTSSMVDMSASFNSMPNSPTSAAPPPPSPKPAQHKRERRGSAGFKHLRDRLRFLADEPGKSSAPKGGGADDDEQDPDDPYSWISRTAPVSPQLQNRRRRLSEGISEDEQGSASMEKLGERVKRRVRHAWNSIDTTHGVPVAHRAQLPPPASADRPEAAESRAGGLFLRLRGRRKSSSHSEEGEKQKRSEEDVSDDSCSSPEQETVSKRPSLTSARGPPVHQLFTNLAKVNSVVVGDAGGGGGKRDDLMTAVLPDGTEVMTTSKLEEKRNSKMEPSSTIDA